MQLNLVRSMCIPVVTATSAASTASASAFNRFSHPRRRHPARKSGTTRRIAALASLAATLAAQGQTVTPSSINTGPSPACGGGAENHSICVTLPTPSVKNRVDVFLLFDDTGSFSSVASGLSPLFNSVVSCLTTAFPTVDFAFGVGRFEDFGGPYAPFSGDSASARPFTLNQGVWRTANVGFGAAMASALANTAPGGGGDSPETAIEALYQVATGFGFDGNCNGSLVDSGSAGALATQVTPGTSGDVPPFSTYVGTADGSLGGVGWRECSLRIVLLATDVPPVSPFVGTAIPATVAGTGSTEPSAVFAASNSSAPGAFRYGFVSDTCGPGNTVVNAVAPVGAADVSATVAALNALGIRVIGLAPNGAPSSSPGPANWNPSVTLSALARLTGAIDASGTPLVFNISGSTIVADICGAITTALTSPIDITLDPVGVPAGLSVTWTPPVQTAVGPGATACFNVTFTGSTAFTGGVFQVNIVDSNSNDPCVGAAVPVTLSCKGVDCDVEPPTGPPFIHLGREQLGGDVTASGAHNSIAAIGLINNPLGYVSVGSRALPSGHQGLHLVRWNRAGDIVVERLFRTDVLSETIIGTSVEVGDDCILVGGTTQSAAGPSTFVARFDIDLKPIWGPVATHGARRVPGNNNGTNPQADWLSDGSIVICGMDGAGSNPAFGHVARLTAGGTQMWSNRYQSLWTTPNPRFIVEDVQQDPAGGNIWTCGGIEHPITPTTFGIVPMVAQFDLASGAVVSSHAYPFPPGSTWTQGRYRAIRFNPTIGPRNGDIVVAGWSSKPGGLFDPTVVAARVGLLDRSSSSPLQHWDRVYPGALMLPGTSAVSIAPQSYPYPNQIVVAGSSFGGFGQTLFSGHTLRTAEADGAFVSAQRHGFPDIPDKTYGLRDITPGSNRVMVGVMSDIQPFSGGGSRFWFSEGACPTPYSSGVESVTYEVSQVGSEVGVFEDTIVPMGLVELPVVSPRSTLCQESIGWAEPFDDDYLLGAISAEGLWEPWDDNPEWATAEVTSDVSRSAPHSLAVDLQDDVVRQFGFMDGQWRFTAWQFVPSDFVGESFLILLNNYVHGGPYNASVQLAVDGAAEVIEDRDSGDTLPLTRDQWVEIRMDINLDADTVSVYYGGRLLVTKNWQDAAGSGEPLPAIGAVDLYANGASPVHYDDLSLVPANLCLGDLDGDGFVNGADIAMILGNWGGPDGDLSGDGTTDGADIAILLGSWGACVD